MLRACVSPVTDRIVVTFLGMVAGGNLKTPNLVCSFLGSISNYMYFVMDSNLMGWDSMRLLTLESVSEKMKSRLFFGISPQFETSPSLRYRCFEFQLFAGDPLKLSIGLPSISNLYQVLSLSFAK